MIRRSILLGTAATLSACGSGPYLVTDITDEPSAKVRIVRTEKDYHLSAVAYMGENCKDPRNLGAGYALLAGGGTNADKSIDYLERAFPAGKPIAIELGVIEFIGGSWRHIKQCSVRVTFTPETSRQYEAEFAASSDHCTLGLYQITESHNGTRNRQSVQNVDHNTERCW